MAVYSYMHILWTTEESYKNFSQKNDNVAKVNIGYVYLKYEFRALLCGYTEDKYNHYTFGWFCEVS